MAYTKLFNSIITSTIWSEDDRTRIVWITMLACADRNGEVQGSIPGLARIAGVPVDDCRAAITKFLSPDLDSRTKEDEGRRIEEISGGWALLNYRKYRDMASDEDRKNQAAVRQKRFRDRANRNSNATVTHTSRQIPQAEADKQSAEGEGNSEEIQPSPSAPSVEKPSKTPSAMKVMPSGFEDFWSRYPKRIAKSAAVKAFRKISHDTLPKIYADLDRRKFSPDWLKEHGKYIPNPATYLNGERWMDESDRPQVSTLTPENI